MVHKTRTGLKVEIKFNLTLDKNAYGYRMLIKMGWKEGTGLGKYGTGLKTHIRVSKKSDVYGLGIDDSDKANKSFVSTESNYNELLRRLNEANGK